ncbi:MAG: hypothetical protein ACK4WC_11165 [Rubrimonas sp.]
MNGPAPIPSSPAAAPRCPAEPGAPLRLQLGAVTIHATGAVIARRVADALPGALDRALSAWTQGDPAPAPRSGEVGLADAAAAQIVAALATRIAGGTR